MWADGMGGVSGVQILGGIGAALFGVWMVVIGAYMLLSPRAWFRLPRWLAFRGALTQKQHATGWRALQVRITGGVLVGTIVWVLYDMFLAGPSR
jgi:phosphotransferase system  glucose/maltose/N-acetylglucosamine-specific IIC component